MDNQYYYYKIFDKQLRSSTPIHELPSLATSILSQSRFTFHISQSLSFPDKISWLHRWGLPDGRISFSLGQTKNSYWLEFPGIATFKITDLEEITCYPISTYATNTINHLLIDQVIPRIISHSGQSVLHGSSIVVNNFATCFLGPSKAGKSSLAAFFQQQGHPLISDDAIILTQDANRLMCLPGYKGLRLWSDSLVNLKPMHDYCEEMSHYCSKKRLFSSDLQKHEYTQYPVKTIFFLNKQTTNSMEIEITPIQGPQAVIQMIQNTLPLDITNKEYIKSSFFSLSKIIQSEFLRVYKLSFPHTFSMLPEVYLRIIKKVVEKGN